MNRLLATNLVLTGIVIGTLLAWACGGSTANPGGGDPREANAQTTSECLEWEAKFVVITATEEAHNVGPWEPVGGGANGLVVVRRCVN
jgi:hypothetical protein